MLVRLSLKQLKALIESALNEKEKPDSGPFNVDDDVYFGKYKNKSGKIKKIYNDEKDHVALEIEPVPKGRKKNVEMGLYKIWPKATEPE